MRPNKSCLFLRCKRWCNAHCKRSRKWTFRWEPWISTRMTIQCFARGVGVEWGGGQQGCLCVSHRQTHTWLQMDGCLQPQWPHAFDPLFLWWPLLASLSSPGPHWGADINGMTRTTKTWNSHPLTANCACACESVAETPIRQKQQRVSKTTTGICLLYEKSW